MRQKVGIARSNVVLGDPAALCGQFQRAPLFRREQVHGPQRVDHLVVQRAHRVHGSTDHDFKRAVARDVEHALPVGPGIAGQTHALEVETVEFGPKGWHHLGDFAGGKGGVTDKLRRGDLLALLFGQDGNAGIVIDDVVVSAFARAARSAVKEAVAGNAGRPQFFGCLPLCRVSRASPTCRVLHKCSVTHMVNDKRIVEIFSGVLTPHAFVGRAWDLTDSFLDRFWLLGKRNIPIHEFMRIRHINRVEAAWLAAGRRYIARADHFRNLAGCFCLLLQSESISAIRQPFRRLNARLRKSAGYRLPDPGIEPILVYVCLAQPCPLPECLTLDQNI